MSDSPAAAVPAEAAVSPTAGVDSHLQKWRHETQRRRSIWDKDHAAFVEEQRARRERFLMFASAGSFAFVVTLGAAVWMYGQWNEVAVPAVPVHTVATLPALPPAVEAPVTSAPVVAAAPEAPAVVVAPVVVEAPAAAPAITAASLGLSGEVVSWQVDGMLWIQADVVGDGRELQWLDAAGAVAMEPTACTYVLNGGLRRCYIGRTARRVQEALDAGSKPGTWTAQLCADGSCATVASYVVP